MSKSFLTIFTPTYNRGYVLPRLYASLCRQSCKDFEWIIVDDGSVDDTRCLVTKWIAEDEIKIRYYYQQNSGKPMAHNVGVEKTDTELFVCVDSDDFLRDDAVEVVMHKWTFAAKQAIIGMVFKKGDMFGKSITFWNQDLQKESFFVAQKRHGLRGDTMLVWVAEILKQVSFPRLGSEKFIPEGYLYDRLSTLGKVSFFDEVLYLCEYLPDGYTHAMRRINAENPLGYQLYIQERLKMDVSAKDRFLDSIRYVAIKLVIRDGRLLKDAVYPFFAMLSFIPGWIFYVKNYRKLSKRGKVCLQ